MFLQRSAPCICLYVVRGTGLYMAVTFTDRVQQSAVTMSLASQIGSGCPCRQLAELW
jgi:hypothetical protein